VRYVIDYYTGRTTTAAGTNPFSFYIDARPAMDSVEGIRMRLSALWSGLFAKKEDERRE
jgi:cytochrome c heme-lyase